MKAKLGLRRLVSESGG
jgi:hypothetical protein